LRQAEYGHFLRLYFSVVFAAIFELNK